MGRILVAGICEPLSSETAPHKKPVSDLNMFHLLLD